MKQIVYGLAAVMAAMVIGGCQPKNPNECRIHGTMNGEQYEGKRIFLVPVFGPKTAEYVDSIEVKDGRFEFATDSAKMFKIVLDYHYRLGVQPLLVVGEPGDVQVVIDSVSHASGTPQNDSLEQWKVRTEQHNLQLRQMLQMVESLKKNNSQEQADFIKQRSDSFHLSYKNYTRQMARNMEGTTLGDFLKDLYPLTYKRQMPDGSIKTFNSDTNEEVSEK